MEDRKRVVRIDLAEGAQPRKIVGINPRLKYGFDVRVTLEDGSILSRMAKSERLKDAKAKIATLPVVDVQDVYVPTDPTPGFQATTFENIMTGGCTGESPALGRRVSVLGLL